MSDDLLSSCPVCSHLISKNTSSCPNCGDPDPFRINERKEREDRRKREGKSGCPVCSQPISKNTSSCPNCGEPDPFRYGKNRDLLSYCPVCVHLISKNTIKSCPNCGEPDPFGIGWRIQGMWDTFWGRVSMVIVCSWVIWLVYKVVRFLLG